MIPLVAHLRIRRHRNRGFGLWVPLFLAWLVLAPLVLLLLPFFIVACVVGDVNPWQALLIFWQILVGFKSSYIEVANRRHSMLIHTF